MKNLDIEPNSVEPAEFLFEAEFRFKNLTEAQAVAHFLANACPNPRLAIIGISEIFFNAIEHGNLNITYEEKTHLQKENIWLNEIERRLHLPENLNKHVLVLFKRYPEELHIRVTDEGNGFDWQKYEHLEDAHTKSHGRGIPIAKNVAFSRLEFKGKGNEVLGVIKLKE